MRKKHRKLYNKVTYMDWDGENIETEPMTIMEIPDLWKHRIFFNLRNLFGQLIVYFQEYEWIPVTERGWEIAKKRAERQAEKRKRAERQPY
ncbi:MAG: hypothetical protein KKB90_11465 [Actinobacteria bacterium]|nr:hypothetical protein [Actinomycetota bacterium]MCG2820257.1 hypothetical protein [Actinomycetes bacterium]MBU4219563.1 hypothetical protein [Actinomycetota bacterium]MBU4358131.1 hypothetical protein [Actinomycetota bacterium]MBU4392353.1 hypothetical protein [Actinomycetota bacterium]